MIDFLYSFLPYLLLIIMVPLVAIPVVFLFFLIELLKVKLDRTILDDED